MTIKSYVLRQGHVTERQRAGLEKFLPLYQVETLETCDNLIVDIGFGMGQTLALMAQQNPELNFLGLDVHKPGAGALAASLCENNITNVKIICEDAVTIFKTKIAKNSVAGIQIFFPDPWPKKKHHKRRLIQPEFVEILSASLKKGGFLHIATDWEHYAEHILKVLYLERTLSNNFEPFMPRPESRPLTKFEKRGQKLGHVIRDIYFEKL